MPSYTPPPFVPYKSGDNGSWLSDLGDWLMNGFLGDALGYFLGDSVGEFLSWDTVTSFLSELGFEDVLSALPTVLAFI